MYYTPPVSPTSQPLVTQDGTGEAQRPRLLLQEPPGWRQGAKGLRRSRRLCPPGRPAERGRASQKGRGDHPLEERKGAPGSECGLCEGVGGGRRDTYPGRVARGRISQT